MGMVAEDRSGFTRDVVSTIREAPAGVGQQRRCSMKITYLQFGLKRVVIPIIMI
jgi:hypothetical protein